MNPLRKLEAEISSRVLTSLKPRISISFSGGRTSSVMTELVLKEFGSTHQIVVLFANTGQEHPATLDFVRECDARLGFGTVWLEAEVSVEKGKGVRHRVVSYETASRDGRPFRDCIAKYGIPNMGSPQCTTRLKENVMTSYLRQIGWGGRSLTKQPLVSVQTKLIACQPEPPRQGLYTLLSNWVTPKRR